MIFFLLLSFISASRAEFLTNLSGSFFDTVLIALITSLKYPPFPVIFSREFTARILTELSLSERSLIRPGTAPSASIPSEPRLLTALLRTSGEPSFRDLTSRSIIPLLSAILSAPRPITAELLIPWLVSERASQNILNDSPGGSMLRIERAAFFLIIFTSSPSLSRRSGIEPRAFSPRVPRRITALTLFEGSSLFRSGIISAISSLTNPLAELLFSAFPVRSSSA